VIDGDEVRRWSASRERRLSWSPRPWGRVQKTHFDVLRPEWREAQRPSGRSRPLEGGRAARHSNREGVSGVAPSPRIEKTSLIAPAVEFGVEIAECRGVVRVPRRVFQRLLPERPTPERCVEGLLSPANPVREHRRAENPWCQLTQDGNVEIRGRDPRPYTSDKVCSRGRPQKS
jgi:hypothetical protein